MVEKFENINMKDVILGIWKNKISFPFNYKDLEELEKIIDYYEGENKELKKQLEEINNFINKANFANIEQLMLDYCAKTEEQKEFIEWLEIRIKDRDKVRKMHELYSLSEERLSSQYFVLQDVLSKYKEIIGGKDEGNKKL